MKDKNKEKIVIKAGKALVNEGLIARTWGNVSIRDGDTFLITASGRDYMVLTEDEIVAVNLETLEHTGNVLPSSEYLLHAAIYNEKKDVNFIIHTHQDKASAMSVLGIKKFKINDLQNEGKFDLLGGEVHVGKYGHPGTARLAQNTLKAVKESKGHAVIMNSHGAVCYGESFEQALEAANQLETAMGYELEKRNIDCEVSHDFDEEKVYIEDGIYYVKNQEPLVMVYSKLSNVLRPYIDDFAQIVGLKAMVTKEGILCRGKDLADLKAYYMIVNKNVLAYFAARTSRLSRPLSTIDARLLRQNYLNHYSRKKNKPIV